MTENIAERWIKGPADKRSRRTRNLIKQVFMALLKEKPIERITVTELCRIADLNRSTFYQYYGDVYMLLEEVEADFLEQVDQAIQEIIEDSTTPPDKITRWVLDYIYQQKELIYLFVFKYKQVEFWEKLDQKILHLFRSKVLQIYVLPANVSNTVFEDTLLFLAAGFYAMYKRWLGEGCQGDIEALADRTTELSLICLDQLLLRKEERAAQREILGAKDGQKTCISGK